jgi:hypothetical protein
MGRKLLCDRRSQQMYKDTKLLLNGAVGLPYDRRSQQGFLFPYATMEGAVGLPYDRRSQQEILARRRESWCSRSSI